MKKDFKLPEGAEYLGGRYGRIYPKEQGYYAIEVGYKPAIHIHELSRYTLDVFKNGEYVTTICCTHGEY